MLDIHHNNLSILFPAFAAACSCENLVDAVAGVIGRWVHHSSAAPAGVGDPAMADSAHGRHASHVMWSTPEFSDGTLIASEAA
jgi:hypothetical protein